LDNFLFEAKGFIALDVTGRWFKFNFFIVSHVDNFDKDIGRLFLLILHNGRHDMIVRQFLIEVKKFIVFDVTKGFLDLIFSIVEYLTIINWRLL
jgi:hypothetical protein